MTEMTMKMVENEDGTITVGFYTEHGFVAQYQPEDQALLDYREEDGAVFHKTDSLAEAIEILYAMT